MRSIFLGDETQIFRVWQDDVVKELEERVGLDRRVFKKEDLENTRDTEFIFSTWGMPAFTKQEIKERFPRLRAIFYAAGTVQSFAREFLECGVKVYSAWAANAVPVAEYTVAQITLANKGFFQASRLASTARYAEARTVFENYCGNFGTKVGIIGAGMIGSLVIEKLKALRGEVLVFDPFLSDERAETLGVKKVSLDRIFSECQVISNHLADNEQTRGMLTGALFEKMPPYATFLNTGRGAQVVESDLVEVLKKRPDLTAILDVTYPEPPLSGSELYNRKNIILTPHIAGSGGNEVHRMAEYMLDELDRYLSGKECRYEVTLKMLETMA